MGEYFFILVILAAIVGFFIFLYFVPINLWITAIFSGVRVGLLELVFMRIRRVPPGVIVQSLIIDKKFIEMVDKWMEESEDKIQDPYVSIHWYNATGEEKEVCFDNVQELGQFLRENPGLAWLSVRY